MSDMIDLYHQRNANVIAIETVPDDDIDKYGIVALDDAQATATCHRDCRKPRREDALLIKQ